jgi:hypothetical protein
MQQKQPEAWYERASDSRILRILTWLVWLGALIATSIAVARHPTDRTVTINYRDAAIEFWSQLPMYKEGQHGWLYPPQGAVVEDMGDAPNWAGCENEIPRQPNCSTRRYRVTARSTADDRATVLLQSQYAAP